MRADGFYWVRVHNKATGEDDPEWTIGDWHEGNWFLVGCEEFLDDSDIAEVGEWIERK